MARPQGHPNTVDACWKKTKCITKFLKQSLIAEGLYNNYQCVICGKNACDDVFEMPVFMRRYKKGGHAHVICINYPDLFKEVL